jgi:hypothetical protein
MYTIVNPGRQMLHEVGLGNQSAGVPIVRWVKCSSEKKAEINESSSEKKASASENAARRKMAHTSGKCSASEEGRGLAPVRGNT